MTGNARSEAAVVLIHGAYHGPWCWSKVVPLLAGQGLNAVTVCLPFTGFHDDVAEVRRTLLDLPGPIVACGHSYGGRVMSAAVQGIPGVRHLVYLAALMLDEEQRRSYECRIGETQKPTFAELDLDTVRGRYYADCAEGEVRRCLEMLRPMVADVDPTEGLASEPWRTLPSTYVLCRQDRAIDPRLQELMAQHAQYVVALDTSHSPFLSRPESVADVLASAAMSEKLSPTGVVRRSAFSGSGGGD